MNQASFSKLIAHELRLRMRLRQPRVSSRWRIFYFIVFAVIVLSLAFAHSNVSADSLNYIWFCAFYFQLSPVSLRLGRYGTSGETVQLVGGLR